MPRHAPQTLDLFASLPTTPAPLDPALAAAVARIREGYLTAAEPYRGNPDCMERDRLLADLKAKSRARKRA